MKNLKIILLCSIIFGFLFYFRICTFHSYYHGDETKLEGILYSYQIDGNQLKAEIKAKEKIIFTYYFATEKEKIEFHQYYHLGDTIGIEGTFVKPSTNRNFHLFNYQNYLKSKHIFWTIQGEKIELIKKNENLLFSIKNSIVNAIEKRKNAKYFKYLLLGDSSQINDLFQEKASILGISHLFAISGMHIHLIVGILTMTLKKITKKEKIHLLFITCFLGFYVFLTDFSPSIIRASCFYLLLSLKKLWNIKISSLFLLFFIFASMLFYNPYYGYHLGFLFSFIVSFSLLYFSKHLKETSYIKQLFQTSWIAFWIGVPILIRNFFEVNFLTPIWNLFFVPFVSFLLFPMCLICLLFPFCNPILDILLWILQVTMDFGNQIRILQFSFAFISIPVMIIYYIVILYALTCFFQKQYKPFFLLFVLLFVHYHIAFWNPYASLTMIDVGQGDSILIVLPHNQGNILIDTGGTVSYPKEDWMQRKKEYSIGESTIIPYLQSIGIHHLDYLILTHGDYDHMGESINLVENFKVEKVIFNCGVYNDLENELIEVLEKRNINYSSCIKELNINNNKLYFLNTKEYDNENDNSNVIYTELNHYKFLFMGDASTLTEQEILNKYNLPNIDVLKVGHHGSKTSSSKVFLDTINPKFSIISVGKNNRYGHPNKKVLEHLENSIIYRTDIDGSIMFKVKNNRLGIKTCPP